MDCRHAKELAEQYLDGTLGDVETEALRRHLQSCAECRSYVSAAEHVLHALPEALSADPPTGIVDRIVSGVDAHRHRRRLRRRIAIALSAAGAAAAAVLLAAFWPRALDRPVPPQAGPTLELVDRSAGWVARGLDTTYRVPGHLLEPVEEWLTRLDTLPDTTAGALPVVPDSTPLEWVADAGRGLLQELGALGSPALESFSFLPGPAQTHTGAQTRRSAG